MTPFDAMVLMRRRVTGALPQVCAELAALEHTGMLPQGEIRKIEEECEGLIDRGLIFAEVRAQAIVRVASLAPICKMTPPSPKAEVGHHVV